MFISKVSIEKLITILTDIQNGGHTYVSMTIQNSPDKHVIAIHPVEETDDPDPSDFNSNLLG